MMNNFNCNSLFIVHYSPFVGRRCSLSETASSQKLPEISWGNSRPRGRQSETRRTLVCGPVEKTKRTSVSPGSGEIDRKIRQRAGPPVKPRVQGELLEITVEYQVVPFIRRGPCHDSQPLEILPDVRGLFDSSELDQALDVRLSRR